MAKSRYIPYELNDVEIDRFVERVNAARDKKLREIQFRTNRLPPNDRVQEFRDMIERTYQQTARRY